MKLKVLFHKTSFPFDFVKITFGLFYLYAICCFYKGSLFCLLECIIYFLRRKLFERNKSNCFSFPDVA